MDIRIYDSKQTVAEHFSEYFKELADAQDTIHIALSGGSTPKIVFDELAANYGNRIDWSKVYFYWGDERCVPPTDGESNYKMAVAHLLSKIEVPEKNVYRMKGENHPKAEAGAYGHLLESKLKSVDGIPQFDLIILGMGDDGHTASIFPYEISLWDANALCEVATHPDSGQKRVTLTGKVINNAKNVAFLITGTSKAGKVKEIVKREGDYQKYPASLVNPTAGRLIWFLDDAAAADLNLSEA